MSPATSTPESGRKRAVCGLRVRRCGRAPGRSGRASRARRGTARGTRSQRQRSVPVARRSRASSGSASRSAASVSRSVAGTAGRPAGQVREPGTVEHVVPVGVRRPDGHGRPPARTDRRGEGVHLRRRHRRVDHQAGAVRTDDDGRRRRVDGARRDVHPGATSTRSRRRQPWAWAASAAAPTMPAALRSSAGTIFVRMSSSGRNSRAACSRRRRRRTGRARTGSRRR